jgi:hypothetical protein
MTVGRRWVLACALGCTLWSLPWPLAALGLLLGGLPMTYLLRPLIGGWRAARLTWALPLYLVVLIPIGFVIVGTSFTTLGGWGAVIAAGVAGGALLGLVHALVFADWIGWWQWVVRGGAAGPAILLVFLSWDLGFPLGFVAGAAYGLATWVPATWSIGRLVEARP